MLNRYSIIIHPEDSIIELFKSYKDTLFSKIGRFGSRNSAAHITILEFEATEKELPNIIEILLKIAQKESSFDVVFDKVIYSKTIFISPDKDGNACFKTFLKNVRQKIKGSKNTSGAHLTIGRELKPEQVENSQDLFHNVNFSFHCCQIALRKFNENIGQYEILQLFPFSGEHPKEEVMQLSLF